MKTILLCGLAAILFAGAVRAETSKIYNMEGSPEGVQYGNNGDLCTQKTGSGAYIKTGGYGNTGWVAVFSTTGGIVFTGTASGSMNMGTSVLTSGTYVTPALVSPAMTGTQTGTVTDNTTRTVTGSLVNGGAITQTGTGGSIRITGTSGGFAITNGAPAATVVGSLVTTATSMKLYLTATTGVEIKTGTNSPF